MQAIAGILQSQGKDPLITDEFIDALLDTRYEERHAFSILAMRRVSDATNGFRIFKASILKDPAIDLHQSWLTSYDLEPYVLYKAIRLGYRVVEHPVTVRYHGDGYTKMQGVRDWWRLFRPALLLRTGLKH